MTGSMNAGGRSSMKNRKKIEDQDPSERNMVWLSGIEKQNSSFVGEEEVKSQSSMIEKNISQLENTEKRESGSKQISGIDL